RLSQIIKAPEKMVGRGAIGIFFGATFAAAAMTLGWTVNLGLAGAVLAGVIAGVFVGLLAMSLAEVLQVMPVTLSNLSLKKGIPVFLMAILLGKTFGSILYFIYPIWP
ncbi:MAG: stage V sporulation protein AB, partial [Christensenellales bacterium]